MELFSESWHLFGRRSGLKGLLLPGRVGKSSFLHLGYFVAVVSDDLQRVRCGGVAAAQERRLVERDATGEFDAANAILAHVPHATRHGAADEDQCHDHTHYHADV